MTDKSLALEQVLEMTVVTVLGNVYHECVQGSVHGKVDLKNSQYEIVYDRLWYTLSYSTARRHRSDAHTSPRWPPGR